MGFQRLKGKLELQELMFPKGILFDREKNDYRTIETNPVMFTIVEISRSLEGKNKGDLELFNSKSPSVPCGFDLSNFIDDFQSLRILMNSRNWKSVF